MAVIESNGEVSVEQIERNKDKIDILPSLRFIADNMDYFKTGIDRFLQRITSPYVQKKVDNLEFSHRSNIDGLGITPHFIAIILLKIPEVLWRCSRLKTINFSSAQEVPIPAYDELGNCIGYSEFVEKTRFVKENMSSRILVGYTDTTATNICLTPIPENIEKNAEVIQFYQIYVLLHEFFHTIEMTRRSKSARRKIYLMDSRHTYSFQNWWKSFENLLLSRKEDAVSNYAQIYDDDLINDFSKLEDKKLKREKYLQFSYAVAENIADTFAAYCLGLLPNKSQYQCFRAASLGNEKIARRFGCGKFESANKKWYLMNKLCNSTKIF